MKIKIILTILLISIISTSAKDYFVKVELSLDEGLQLEEYSIGLADNNDFEFLRFISYRKLQSQCIFSDGKYIISTVIDGPSFFQTTVVKGTMYLIIDTNLYDCKCTFNRSVYPFSLTDINKLNDTLFVSMKIENDEYLRKILDRPNINVLAQWKLFQNHFNDDSLKINGGFGKRIRYKHSYSFNDEIETEIVYEKINSNGQIILDSIYFNDLNIYRKNISIYNDYGKLLERKEYVDNSLIYHSYIDSIENTPYKIAYSKEKSNYYWNDSMLIENITIFDEKNNIIYNNKYRNIGNDYETQNHCVYIESREYTYNIKNDIHEEIIRGYYKNPREKGINYKYFNYDSSGKLINIIECKKNKNNLSKLDTFRLIEYNYDKARKLSEEIEIFRNEIIGKVLYQYNENGDKIREEKYNGESLVSYITTCDYKYKNNKIMFIEEKTESYNNQDTLLAFWKKGFNEDGKLLLEERIYQGELSYIEEYEYNKLGKITKYQNINVLRNKYNITIERKYDKYGNILEELTYYDGKLTEKITYEYFKE